MKSKKQTPSKDQINQVLGSAVLNLSGDDLKNFNPMDDLNQAMRIAEVFQDFRIHKNKKGYKCYLRRRVKNGPGDWDWKYECASVTAPTVAEAICQSALEAKELLEDKSAA